MWRVIIAAPLREPAHGPLDLREFALAVTGCVVGGIEAFERGDTDAFWRREGRADFIVYLQRVCKRLEREGINPDSPDDPAIARVGGSVIRGMIGEGLIKRP